MTMGPMHAMRGGAGAPPRTSKDVRATLRRLLRRLHPDRWRLLGALLLGIISVAFMVSGPQILGNATNVLFDGIIAKRLPAGTTMAQALQYLRDHGHAQTATMIAGLHLTPGVGVNIDRLGAILGVAALVVGLVGLGMINAANPGDVGPARPSPTRLVATPKIGRASCRERVSDYV